LVFETPWNQDLWW